MGSPAEIRPFDIAVSDDVLDDLKTRLAATRWPEAELVDDWSQGTPISWLKEVCDTWANDYDWRAREAALNRFDHFLTEIDGVDIHFVHQRSPHENATPLLITHGWPGSIVEFHKIIEPLSDPTNHGGSADDAFHVICPSLPGFGFSGKPTETGWGVEKIALVWKELMARLGYDSYLAQGGDWGSAVTTSIGWQDPDHCSGIHITLAMGTSPAIDGEPTEEEQRAIAGATFYQQWDSGYSSQQRTRPQTIGYSLVDSPAGLAAWVLEKFWAWTDCDGHPENVLDRNELIDNLMLYWATETGASAARIYWESFGSIKREPVPVPTGVTVHPKEIVTPVRHWMEPNYPNITYWNEQNKGGHFAAFEQPEMFVEDIRQWARSIT